MLRKLPKNKKAQLKMKKQNRFLMKRFFLQDKTKIGFKDHLF